VLQQNFRPQLALDWLVGSPERALQTVRHKIPNLRLIRGHKSPMCLDTSMDWPAESDTGVC
jgi:hypothetical protein